MAGRTAARWCRRPGALLAALLAVSVHVGCTSGGSSQPDPAASRAGVPTAPGTPAEGAYPATVRVGSLPPLRVQVADTPAERRQGLAGRRHLPAGTGMLFRFEEPVTVGFWMYDVHFPLSLVWIRDGRVTGTVEMAPCTSSDPDACPSYEPPGPYDTVVEAPGGTFAGIERGTPVRVRLHPVERGSTR